MHRCGEQERENQSGAFSCSKNKKKTNDTESIPIGRTQQQSRIQWPYDSVIQIYVKTSGD